jgi:hypothetical protein
VISPSVSIVSGEKREEIERLLDQVNSALDLLDPNEKD